MSLKLPVVSGKELIKFLSRFGYEIQRQRGSHVRLKKAALSGAHSITIPMHHEVARGTLNDILNSVALHCQTPKDALIQQLGEFI